MLEYRYDTQLLIAGHGLDDDRIKLHFHTNAPRQAQGLPG